MAWESWYRGEGENLVGGHAGFADDLALAPIIRHDFRKSARDESSGASGTVAQVDACEFFPLRGVDSRPDMLFCTQLLPSIKA
jgi:hypothetical protein